MGVIAKVLVWLCALAWIAMVAQGVLTFMTLEAEGSGFTRGMNRIQGFLRWELYALGAAAAASAIGRLGQVSGAARYASRLPLWLSGGFFVLLIVGFAALVIYTKVVG